MSVYEDEPSSIIAYTLLQQAYTDFLDQRDRDVERGDARHDSMQMNEDTDDPSLSAAGTSTHNDGHTHFKFQFADKTTKFYCQVLFRKYEVELERD